MLGVGLVGLLSLFAIGSSSNKNNINEVKNDTEKIQQAVITSTEDLEKARVELKQKMQEVGEALTNSPLREDINQEVHASEKKSTTETVPVENTNNKLEVNSQNKNLTPVIIQVDKKTVLIFPPTRRSASIL